MKVGFIGLGIMGASMASNLQAAGHGLYVNDIRREAAAPHLTKGAVWKDNPRQVADAVEVVFTSLPGPVEVEAVALGADGLIHGLRPGAPYFDLSTNSPSLIRRLHATFHASGIACCRELLGMPHQREAIARVVMASCLPRPRPVEQGDWPVAVLLQHPLHGRHADPRPLRDRRIAEKAVALP